MPINVDDGFSVGISVLHELGTQDAPNPDQFKVVAHDRMVGTDQSQVGTADKTPGMTPFGSGVRKARRIEMSDHRVVTHSFEDTLEADGVKLNSVDYVAAFGEGIFDMGYAQTSHPNQLVFGALKGATKKTYTVTRHGESASFPMATPDGQPVLSLTHPQKSGVPVSNAISLAPDNANVANRWYVVATAARPPLVFARLVDYEFDEEMDPHAWAENKTYRFRAYAHVGVGAWEWRSIVASEEDFDNDSLDEALVRMASFENNEGDVRGQTAAMVLAPYRLRAKVLKVLGGPSVIADNFNQAAGIGFQLSPWL